MELHDTCHSSLLSGRCVVLPRSYAQLGIPKPWIWDAKNAVVGAVFWEFWHLNWRTFVPSCRPSRGPAWWWLEHLCFHMLGIIIPIIIKYIPTLSQQSLSPMFLMIIIPIDFHIYQSGLTTNGQGHPHWISPRPGGSWGVGWPKVGGTETNGQVMVKV